VAGGAFPSQRDAYRGIDLSRHVRGKGSWVIESPLIQRVVGSSREGHVDARLSRCGVDDDWLGVIHGRAGLDGGWVDFRLPPALLVPLFDADGGIRRDTRNVLVWPRVDGDYPGRIDSPRNNRNANCAARANNAPDARDQRAAGDRIEQVHPYELLVVRESPRELRREGRCSAAQTVAGRLRPSHVLDCDRPIRHVGAFKRVVALNHRNRQSLAACDRARPQRRGRCWPSGTARRRTRHAVNQYDDSGHGERGCTTQHGSRIRSERNRCRHPGGTVRLSREVADHSRETLLVSWATDRPLRGNEGACFRRRARVDPDPTTRAQGTRSSTLGRAYRDVRFHRRKEPRPSHPGRVVATVLATTRSGSAPPRARAGCRVPYVFPTRRISEHFSAFERPEKP
jgi:hypothetical protein